VEKIIVINPVGYGEYAKVIPGDNGKLYINGNEVQGELHSLFRSKKL